MSLGWGQRICFAQRLQGAAAGAAGLTRTLSNKVVGNDAQPTIISCFRRRKPSHRAVRVGLGLILTAVFSAMMLYRTLGEGDLGGP